MKPAYKKDNILNKTGKRSNPSSRDSSPLARDDQGRLRDATVSNPPLSDSSLLVSETLNLNIEPEAIMKEIESLTNGPGNLNKETRGTIIQKSKIMLSLTLHYKKQWEQLKLKLKEKRDDPGDVAVALADIADSLKSQNMKIDTLLSEQKTLTYADTLKKGNNISTAIKKSEYHLIVAGKDSAKSSDEIEGIIKRNVNVRSLGIGVTGLRKIAKDRVIIKTDTKDALSKIKSEVEKLKDLHTKEPEKKNPLVVFKGVVKGITEDDLNMSLRKQNSELKLSEELKIRFRKTHRNNLLANIVCQVNPETWKSLTDIGVKELKFTVEPSDVSVLPGRDVTLHCAATGGDTRIQWRWAPALPLDEAPILDPIGDLHRTFLVNGSLQLLRLGPNGAPAGDYQCLVTREGQGAIVSRVAKVTLPTLPIFDAEPRDLAVYPQETAFFACTIRSRVPTPPRHMGLGRAHAHNTPSSPLDTKILWLKNDAPLRLDETRMTVLPSGALEIDPVLPQDGGAYRCNVTRDGGNGFWLSSKAQLTINTDMTLAETVTAPTFIAEPRSQTAVEGSPVIMDCAALGNPRPAIIWLNNGVAIDLSDLDSRFRMLGTGSLYITSVKETDAGPYQCRADNREDSLDATAMLDVQVPPKFKKKPQDVMAVERQDIELECEVYGKPEPIIRWLKNGEVITPNNHDIILVGGYNLKIQGLMASDAGMFQCVASNEAGNIQASAQLTVTSAVTNPAKKNKSKNPKYHKRKTLPSESMENQFFSDNPDVTQYDRNAKRNTDVKFNPSIDSSGIPFDATISRQSLTSLKSTDSEDTKFSGKRDSEINHRNFDSLSHNAFDNLAESDTDQSDVLGHVSLAYTSTPGTIHLSNSNTNNPDSSLTNTLDTPETGIVEEPASNGSLEEGDADSRKTPSEPQQFMAMIVKARFVALSWSEPQVPNGEIIAYSVIYKIRGSVRERIMNTTRGDIYKMNIPSLQPNTQYVFRAVAYNKYGVGATTQVLEITTQSEELSLGPPQDLKVTAESPTVLSVSWQPPQPVPGSKVSVEKYELLWAEVETGDEHSVITLELSHRLSELHPFTEYTVRVAALGAGEGSGSSGSPSEQVVLRTPGDNPSAAPLNLTLTAHSSESVMVFWEPPPVETHNGDITGYKIKYRLLGRSGTSSAKSLTTPADSRSVVLKDLDRMATYQVRVCAINGNGTGPFTEWQTVKTLQNDLDESQVPDLPSPLDTQAGSESIFVLWAPPPKNQNIRVRGYTLSWGKGIPDEVIQGLGESARHYTITDLEPNAEYVISLRARNQAGEGPPVYANVRTKDPSEVEEEDDLGPVDLGGLGGGGGGSKTNSNKQSNPPLIPPVGVKTDVISSTTAVVYWTDTTLSKSQIVTDQRYYVVKYSPVDSQKYKYFNTTHLNCMIDELKPFTPYEFTVKVVKGTRSSPWSMVVVNSTLEAAPTSGPRDIRVAQGSSASSITLHWLPPKAANGAITGYVILYTMDPLKRDRDWIVQAVVGGGTSAIVKPLQPATPYHFKVQARNAIGYGPFSHTVTFTTPAGNGYEDYDSLANGKEIRHGPSWTIITIAGGIVFLVLVVGIVFIVVCCKKGSPSSNPTSSPDSRAKSTYQKASASNIKPPDLWIHHDQMELKQMDKSHHSTSGSGDGVSGVSSMTLPRPSRDSGCEYDTAMPGGRTGPGVHSSNQCSSLDKRHYVPTYVGSPSPTFGDASIGGNSSTGGNSSRNSAFLSSGGQSINSRPTIIAKPKPLLSIDQFSRDTSMSSINACSISASNPDTMPPPGMRPMYPRTQYAPGQMSRGHLNIDQNTPLLSAAGSSLSGTGTLPSQSSLSSLVQAPPSLHHHHHHHTTSSLGISPMSLSSGMSCSVLTGGVLGPAPSPSPSPASEGFPADAREREQGHYVAYEALHPPRDGLEGENGSLGRRGVPGGSIHPLRSFSVPAPPPSEAPHTPHHHVSVMIRPTNTSPYKKPLVPAVPVSHPPPGSTLNRLQQGMPIPHSGDELEPLTSSCSTEQLHQEMVNLEGLMKDLSAITANQFQC